MRLRAKPHPPECIRKLSDLIGVRCVGKARARVLTHTTVQAKACLLRRGKECLAWDPPAEGGPRWRIAVYARQRRRGSNPSGAPSSPYLVRREKINIGTSRTATAVARIGRREESRCAADNRPCYAQIAFRRRRRPLIRSPERCAYPRTDPALQTC